MFEEIFWRFTELSAKVFIAGSLLTVWGVLVYGAYNLIRLALS